MINVLLFIIGNNLKKATPNIETSRYDKLARNIFRARGSRRGLSVDGVTIDRGWIRQREESGWEDWGNSGWEERRVYGKESGWRAVGENRDRMLERILPKDFPNGIFARLKSCSYTAVTRT